MRTVYVYVPGKPRAAPRLTQRRKWSPAGQEYLEWCSRFAWAVYLTVGDLEGVPDLRQPPLFVTVHAYFAVPRSRRGVWTVTPGEPHRSPPDHDNVLKAVQDALWPGTDHRIAGGACLKWWDDGQGPGIELFAEYPRLNEEDDHVETDQAGRMFPAAPGAPLPASLLPRARRGHA